MKERFKAVCWRDVAVRAVKTFIETFLAYFTMDELLGFTDAADTWRFMITCGVSALAAALSVVWNTLMGAAGGDSFG